jgi:group I intron endonuclease
MIIYKIINTISNKIYIGQTIRSLKERIAGYKSEIKRYENGDQKFGRPIIYAMNKYGLDNFQFTIIETAISQKELDEKEKYWIFNYHSNLKEIGYNLDTARGGPGRRSEESKKKTSESLRGSKNNFYGKQHSSKTIKQMSETHLGKIILDETKSKISIALSGEKSGTAKLNNQQVKQLREDRKAGATLKELSNKYKLSISRVSDIINNKTYKV